MAYTVTKIRDYVFGNARVISYDVTADAATQAIATGLQKVDFCHVQPLSMTTTTVPKVAVNVTASGAAANGYVAMTTAVKITRATSFKRKSK